MQWLNSAGAPVAWATGIDASTFTYNNAGRMTIAENQVSKVTRTYDNAGRLLADTQDIKAGSFPTHAVNYTYRADGKVTDIQLDSAQDYEFLFGYDGMARLETIKSVLNTNPDYQYYYDAASNVTKRFNGLSAGSNVVYIYDNLNRISERDINVPTSQIPRGWFSKEHYTYDAMNRLTNVLRDEDVKSDTFTYYLDGEMKDAHYANNTRNVTYNLDLAGNRTSVVDGGTTTTYTASTNNLNQYASVGGNALTYIAAHAISIYAGENYYYIGGTFLAKATVGTNTLLLYYDALGRCVQRSVNGVTTYRIFDGDHFITEYNSSNAFIGNALYGQGIDEVIARSNNNQGQFSFPDRNGNVSVVLGFLGETLESYRYDAFGTPTFYNGAGTLITQSGISNALLYTGREWNQTFGLYEYRARGYDPKLGRFLSEDPKGFDAGDYNLYRYCANDPLDRTDPMGLDVWNWKTGQIYPNSASDFPQPIEAFVGHQVAEMYREDPVGFILMAATMGRGPKESFRMSGAKLEASSAASKLNLSKGLASQEGVGQILKGKGQPIAGAGTKTALRDAPRLAEQYGGKPGEWAKVTSQTYRAADGTPVATHAYQNTATGQIVEVKTKIVDEVPQARSR